MTFPGLTTEMASELDAAIRGMLVQYAKAKGFGSAEDSAEDADNLHQPQETKASDAHSDATTVKKAKMLRVARALVDSNPRVRNKGSIPFGVAQAYSRLCSSLS